MSDIEVKDMTVDQAENILRQALKRMPEVITGWPSHVLQKGTDKEKIEFAILLQRGED